MDIFNTIYEKQENIENKKQVIKPTKELVWNVFDHDCNANKIQIRNLFDMNWPFLGMLYKAYKTCEDFDSFAKAVKSALMHEFWSRSQYEVIITSWPPRMTPEQVDKLIQERNNNKYYSYSLDLETEEKVDVYTQVMMNWDQFISYVYENRKLLRKYRSDYKAYYHR